MKINLLKTNYLRIKVIPKSSKNEIVETIIDADGEETTKIRIKALPEKGKANKEVLNFLSKEFNISKTKLSIISGKSSQIKLIKINHES